MRLQLLTILAAAVALSGLLSPTASAEPDVIPPEWLPALHPSIENALKQMKEATSQSEINRLSREVAEMRDAQLYIAYVRLYQRLGPKARATLVTEQAKWLKARAKAAKEAVESKGSSLAVLEANDAEVTLTEDRLNELRRRYKAAGGED